MRETAPAPGYSAEPFARNEMPEAVYSASPEPKAVADDRMYREMILEHLAKAVRHIESGEKLVAGQRARLAQARKLGLNVTEHERTLTLLEAALSIHIDSRDRARAELQALNGTPDGSFVMPPSKASRARPDSSHVPDR